MEINSIPELLKPSCAFSADDSFESQEAVRKVCLAWAVYSDFTSIAIEQYGVQLASVGSGAKLRLEVRNGNVKLEGSQHMENGWAGMTIPLKEVASISYGWSNPYHSWTFTLRGGLTFILKR